MEDGATVGEPLLVLAAGDAVEVPATKHIKYKLSSTKVFKSLFTWQSEAQPRQKAP